MILPMLSEEAVPPSIFKPIWLAVKDTGLGQTIGFNDPRLGMYWFDAIGFSLTTAIVLVAASFVATSNYRRVPRGLQNIMEAFVSFIRGIVHGFAGKQGDKYVPYLGTVFIFIFVMNLLGILPGFRSPTMTLSTTAALGITTFVMVQSYAIRDSGLGTYLKHFMGPVPALAPLMVPIELISHLARPLSLTLRLFGNMTGGHILLAIIFFLMGLDGLIGWALGGSPAGVIVGGIGGLVMVAFTVGFLYPLKILVSFLQAFIFVMLTMLYIAAAVEEGEHHGAQRRAEHH